MQYADFAIWQRRLLGDEHETARLRLQVEFWRHALANVPAELNLPIDYARPAVAAWRGEGVALNVGPSVHLALLRLAQESHATLFMLVQAALASVLTRLGAGTDVPIGTAFAQRPDPVFEDVIGLFINTLVLRTDTSGRPSFETLIARVRDTALAAYARADVPFERLVDELRPDRSLAGQPLFQVMLSVGAAPSGEPAVLAEGVRMFPEAVGLAVTKFDLSLTIVERHTEAGTPQGLSGWLEYRTD